MPSTETVSPIRWTTRRWTIRAKLRAESAASIRRDRDRLDSLPFIPTSPAVLAALASEMENQR